VTDEAFGAIDLGSNNCRLLIARPTHAQPAHGRPAPGRPFRVLEAYSSLVRLGEDLQRSGRLSQAAMDRAVEALSVCAQKLRRRRVTRLRAVTTEACRRAANGDIFVRRVADETGLTLEVISEREEVGLAADGCVSLIDRRVPHALILDIGGGSTEISHLAVEDDGDPDAPGAAIRVVDWCSLPAGVVNFAERFGGREVTPSAYRAMKEEVRGAVIDFEKRNGLRRLLRRRQVQLIGTSGTVTTLAGVHLDLASYRRTRVDGYRLKLPAVRSISARISAMSYGERAAQGCIGEGRADLVIAGCAILEALCDLWPATALRVADRGLREGILLHLMREAGTTRPGAPQPEAPR
jgi:exopolyphosphatase/guanosine-5'-triphosphate,3'-diphosphate pyrophosphatase